MPAFGSWRYLPMKITTQRLQLEQTKVNDADFILQLVNTPDWLMNIGDRNVHSVRDAEDYIRSRMLPQYERLGYGNFTVRELATGNPVGTCGLYDREGLEGIDLGFAFLPQYHRRGYGFESATALMTNAHQHWGMQNMKAITLETNTASRKLLEKLGFRLTGPVVLEGDPEELLLYSWTTEE